MPEYRIPASAGAFHGELRMSDDGLTFIPVTMRESGQLVLGVDGWHLTWPDVAGIERVDAHGRVRVHYDGAARFVALTVHGPLRELFTIVDRELAAHGDPVHHAA